MQPTVGEGERASGSPATAAVEVRICLLAITAIQTYKVITGDTIWTLPPLW
eukprot:SAG31_NODE_34_length_31842_cov_31.677850_7_plen_51_part_00